MRKSKRSLSQDKRFWLLSAILFASLVVLTALSVFQDRQFAVRHQTVFERLQSSHRIIADVALALDNKPYSLTETCKGYTETLEVDAEFGIMRDACVGENTLSLVSMASSGPPWIIHQSSATSSEEAPSLYNAQALDDQRVLASYFTDTHQPDGDKYGRFAPFQRAPNLLINNARKEVHWLSSFPFEAEPMWNASRTYAIFAAGGNDNLEGGPYPLIGYHVDSDTRFHLTTPLAGAPFCDMGSCPGLPPAAHWENVRWINNFTVSADLVTPTTTKQMEATLPDIQAISNFAFPIQLESGKPAIKIPLKDGVNPKFVVEKGVDKLGQPFETTGYQHLDNAMLITDFDKDGRFDVLLSLRFNAGGTGHWSYPYIVLNKTSGFQIIPVTLDVGDRDIINSITIDDSGLITYNLTVHGPNDGACCPSQPATQKYRYTQGKWTSVK